MLNKKNFSKFLVTALGAYVMLSSLAFACGGYNRDCSVIATDSMTIYEPKDEQSLFDDHGFTRGDMSYLFNGTFDAAQVETLSGPVLQLIRVQFPDKDCYLIAVLSTQGNNGKVAVNLGPVWFGEESGLFLNEGDKIQVSGAKMRTNGRFVVIATEVTKNGYTLNIRDKEGAALWGSPKTQQGRAECMKGSSNGNAAPATGAGSAVAAPAAPSASK